ncbi:hypothetical protein [Nocardioides campestrisoli]|uniref:hypothetical protein n=1 Tax=Nocardioides campestrisoli TaxID=2736757 RepID=UPI0015E64264|nr:hypothetical protein [Nocardioides campestrisoli]
MWFKVDDRLHDHRKARRAGKSAMGLWVLAGSWSAANLTDGFVPASLLPRWGTKADAKRLVDVGLWHDDVQDGEAGWSFHEWLTHQPDARTVRLKQEAESRGGSYGNHVRWHARRGVTDPDCEHCSGRVPDQAPDRGDTSGANPPARPDPARPAAAAAAGGTTPLPPQLEILKSKLDAARMVVRWDRLTTDQHDEIAALVDLHGDGPLIKAAVASHRPDSPASFAQAWLGIWKALPPPGAGLQLVRARCPIHDTQLDAAGSCRSCAADQKAAR